MRLQLTPDPPFIQLVTLTLLGQPKANISCVPLSKHNLNLMDLPLISSFVQSSIDAALAEYVAPKSPTLDLKDMLMEDDFKKDTVHRGVLVVYIKSARDFKEGDPCIGPLKHGSSDASVTASWAEFAKPIASTRIILSDMRPVWNEWSYLLVGPEELNANEQLRLQLWDSDTVDADDDLGRVEVELKALVYGDHTKGHICDREDRLTAENPDEKMPGSLKWSVGYFPMIRITDKQLAQQTAPSLRSRTSRTRTT
jgi:Ca2+-dependent lipid-binding protein